MERVIRFRIDTFDLGFLERRAGIWQFQHLIWRFFHFFQNVSNHARPVD